MPPARLPDEVRVELERVLRRWQQLPLDHALRASGDVRALAQALADEVADAEGRPREALPELGPATLLHQLQVCVYDAARHEALRDDAASHDTARLSPEGQQAGGIRELAQRLAQLRRAVS
ncbi:hypothetical protein [Arsenicicoccus sp. oral taxon 190]|uniref:hypothetical protein n=1 Tax=Arsenicicoccus sp. oral taxon 190 TaxID=1658671 RepID=UPI0012E204DC|nr:hypothetical protein [Arsenicicoccus sp. oral taxon 190]